jgi:hypothetical protein
MSITKQIVVDNITVVENGIVQVREAIRILENNSLISQTFHRKTIAPGDEYSSEDHRVKAICSAIHTADVVEAYQQQLQSIAV